VDKYNLTDSKKIVLINLPRITRNPQKGYWSEFFAANLALMLKTEDPKTLVMYWGNGHVSPEDMDAPAFVFDREKGEFTKLGKNMEMKPNSESIGPDINIINECNIKYIKTSFKKNIFGMELSSRFKSDTKYEEENPVYYENFINMNKLGLAENNKAVSGSYYRYICTPYNPVSFSLSGAEFDAFDYETRKQIFDFKQTQSQNMR
jgi:hypothetical protein